MTHDDPRHHRAHALFDSPAVLTARFHASFSRVRRTGSSLSNLNTKPSGSVENCCRWAARASTSTRGRGTRRTHLLVFGATSTGGPLRLCSCSATYSDGARRWPSGPRWSSRSRQCRLSPRTSPDRNLAHAATRTAQRRSSGIIGQNVDLVERQWRYLALVPSLATQGSASSAVQQSTDIHFQGFTIVELMVLWRYRQRTA